MANELYAEMPQRGTFHIRNVTKMLGPGLITGASDDDPSGIGTYSQVGAQIGYGIGWTMLLTYPLMTAIQEICGRVGRVTGHGIAGNVCRNYPGIVIWSLVCMLFVANTINIAADIGAMADASKLIAGGPAFLYVLLYGVVSIVAQIWFNYKRYVSVLKWLTLSLFAYVIALAMVKIDWSAAIKGVLIPTATFDKQFLTSLVAILGTTISPYLFIWQSSQEAEEQRIDKNKAPLTEDGSNAKAELRRIRLDTMVGMAFSNLIAISVIITTAATLNQNGITDINTSAEAAQALRPVAGPFAELIFCVGIVGTGLLAIPVLAGSTAYAIGEGRKWPVGLSRKPKEATAFYVVMAASGLLGIALNFTPIDPIKALFWSAVINGIVAVPVMVLTMVMVRRRDVMGDYAVKGWLYVLGWLSTATMASCVAIMGLSYVLPD